MNGQAKAAAKSAFESNKQRFFNHLITAMKTPTLLKSIEADLERRRRRRGAAGLDRRKPDGAPPRGNPHVEEWGDLSIDVTPREYVLDYLAKGFPTQLYERYADEERQSAIAARRASTASPCSRARPSRSATG